MSTSDTQTTGDDTRIPGAPTLDGLRFRLFRGPEDYPGLAAANQATRDVAGIEEVITAEVMDKDYRHLVNCDLATDLLVAERQGRIIGYARIEWRDLVDGSRTVQTVGIVEPGELGQGIGGAMLTWLEARGRAIVRGLPADRPTQFGAQLWGTDAHGRSLFTRSGWTERARNYEMVRPTLDDIPVVPLPAGLELRPVTLADRERIWEAAVEAFRDHRAEPEVTEEDRRHVLTDPRQDPSLWAVAFDGDEICGSVIGVVDDASNHHHGRARGLIDEVSVRRPWRRRGLARALVADVLVRLRDHGLTSAYLGVDGLNPNQAMTLYESLGFEISSTTTEWTKPIGDEP